MEIVESDVDPHLRKIVTVLDIFCAFIEMFKKINIIFKYMITFLIDPFCVEHDKKESIRNNKFLFINLKNPTEPEPAVESMLTTIIFITIYKIKQSGQSDATASSIYNYMVARAELRSHKIWNYY